MNECFAQLKMFQNQTFNLISSRFICYGREKINFYDLYSCDLPRYLFILVLGHVRLQLEVGAEFGRAELALVRAVNQENLFVRILFPLRRSLRLHLDLADSLFCSR